MLNARKARNCTVCVKMNATNLSHSLSHTCAPGSIMIQSSNPIIIVQLNMPCDTIRPRTDPDSYLFIQTHLVNFLIIHYWYFTILCSIRQWVDTILSH